MHEHGLERAAPKRGSGWLDRATGSRPSRGRRKLVRRARAPSLNLALQGGGAHGAFTWGVLDRLLEAGRFRYEGISGTSAGAINAVVLASGWLAGGAAGAQASLAALWHQVAEMACPLHRSGLPHAALDATTQLLSPYQLNPLDINPLRDLLERLVDFERLRRDRSLKLFIAATTLRTGTLRMFENRELSADAVLASACLPWLHQAVEIEGEAYWDGGYSATRRFYHSWSAAGRETCCWFASTRASEARFPGAQVRSATGLARSCSTSRSSASSRLLQARRGALMAFSPAQRRLDRHRLHVIDGGDVLSALDPITKLLPEWNTLQRLHEFGRAAASGWLEEAAGPARPRRRRPRARSSQPLDGRLDGFGGDAPISRAS
jgi:NTE family protein